MGRLLNKIARFEKVSFEQFKKDWKTLYQDSDERIQTIYDGIQLPKRATTGSAGYDFFLPIDIQLKPQEKIKIATGIRVIINEGWVLQLYPRSSLGFKYGLTLRNTVGIIDSDYSKSLNEGHMFMLMVNDNDEGLSIDLKQGSAIAQGIFVPFGITEDDDVNEVRTGGFGSTNKK